MLALSGDRLGLCVSRGSDVPGARLARLQPERQLLTAGHPFELSSGEGCCHDRCIQSEVLLPRLGCFTESDDRITQKHKRKDLALF